MIDKRIKIVILAVCMLVSGYFYSSDRKKDISLTVNETAPAETVFYTEPETALSKKEPAMLRVHVCGAVKHAGVYELSEGSIVSDAIEKAGGVVKGGAGDYLNLALAVTDGSKIYVPYEEELKSENGVPIGAGLSGTESGETDSLVNINTASKELLMTLSGIGEAKAEAIIAYREDHGSFSSPESIMNVTGIKQGAYDKIRDQIKV